MKLTKLRRKQLSKRNLLRLLPSLLVELAFFRELELTYRISLFKNKKNNFYCFPSSVTFLLYIEKQEQLKY